jgi:hypothetical protein
MVKGVSLMSATRYSACFFGCALFALPVFMPALAAKAAYAATNIDASQHQVDCRRLQEKEQANLEALKRADPAIQAQWLDSVFYSAKQNSCLATVSFIRHGATYSGIFDVSDSRAVWTKAYRGTALTPTRIVAMDWDLYEKVEELEFAPAH